MQEDRPVTRSRSGGAHTRRRCLDFSKADGAGPRLGADLLHSHAPGSPALISPYTVTHSQVAAATVALLAAAAGGQPSQYGAASLPASDQLNAPAMQPHVRTRGLGQQDTSVMIPLQQDGALFAGQQMLLPEDDPQMLMAQESLSSDSDHKEQLDPALAVAEQTTAETHHAYTGAAATSASEAMPADNTAQPPAYKRGGAGRTGVQYSIVQQAVANAAAAAGAAGRRAARAQLPVSEPTVLAEVAQPPQQASQLSPDDPPKSLPGAALQQQQQLHSAIPTPDTRIPHTSGKASAIWFA